MNPHKNFEGIGGSRDYTMDYGIDEGP